MSRQQADDVALANDNKTPRAMPMIRFLRGLAAIPFYFVTGLLLVLWEITIAQERALDRSFTLSLRLTWKVLGK